MKHNHNHNNAPNPDQSALQPVHFEFTHSSAATVCIAGSFNNWKPEAKPMHPLGRGRWIKDTNLAPGIYEYCMVVDGEYLPDPSAKSTVPNPYGGRNSVLTVSSPPEMTHLAATGNSPVKEKR